MQIADTPGFGNEDDDESYVDALMNSLSNRVNYADAVLLVVPGSTTALSESVQNLLKRISLTFGDGWWDYLVIGVSNWPYDQDSIDDRNQDCEDYPDSCEDEKNFKETFDNIIREDLGQELNLTYVFADAWSQSGDKNKNDISQQTYWNKTTDILWNTIDTRENSFSFKTINQVLEENEEMRGEIKWLNDIIAQNISNLAVLVEQNTKTISINSATIDQNMEQNTEKIMNNSANIEHNLDKIKNNSAIIEQNMEQNTEKITNNSANIEKNKRDIIRNGAEILWNTKKFEQSAPIGTIIAWYGEKLSNTTIPSGWQLCDNSTILFGRMAGQNTPDLNNQGLFLRGGSEESVGQTEEDAIQDHLHVDNGHSHVVMSIVLYFT